MKINQFSTIAPSRKSEFAGFVQHLQRVLLVCVTFSLIAACNIAPATQPEKRLPSDAEVEQYNASVSPEERIICRTETPIGSNIPKRVCRLVVDIEETSTFHRDQLRRSLF